MRLLVTLALVIFIGCFEGEPRIVLTGPTAGTAFSTAQGVVIGVQSLDGISIQGARFRRYGAPDNEFIDVATPPFEITWAVNASHNGPQLWLAQAYLASQEYAVSETLSFHVSIPDQPPVQSGAEVQCQYPDAGVSCILSEPLNFNSPAQWPEEWRFDPPGTGGINEEVNFSRIYGPGGPANLGYGISQTASATTGMLGPDFVTSLRHPITAQIEMNNVVFTGGTFCTRNYQKFEGWPAQPTGGGTGWKGITYTTTNGAGINLEMSLGNANEDLVIWKPTNDHWDFPWNRMPKSGTNLDLDDLERAWSRWEFCVDHESNNRLTVRARVVMLDTCEVQEWRPTTSNASHASAQSGAGRSFPARFKQKNSSGGGSDSGTIHLSHVLVTTKYPRDGTYWPGSAEEIVSDGCAP